MDKFRITGGLPLKGRVSISGAKNSALPCMAAALLTPETVTLHNIPYVRDIITQRRLLEDIGATVLMPSARARLICISRVFSNSARRSGWKQAMSWRASPEVDACVAARFISTR